MMGPLRFKEMSFADAKKIALAYLGKTDFYGLYSRKDIYHEAFEAHILKLHGITRSWTESTQWEMIMLAHRSACKAMELIFGSADCPHPESICESCICSWRGLI